MTADSSRVRSVVGCAGSLSPSLGGDVVRLVVGNAIRVVAGGAAIGLVLAAGASQLLSTVLFGVDAWDPVTFVAVPVVLTLTAAAAIAGPAWRATRIDPAAALRGE